MQPSGMNTHKRKVLEYDNVKIQWDLFVQTDCKLRHNKPDILIVDKQTVECHIIDVACPLDTRKKEKEQEKVEQCQKLKGEIGTLEMQKNGSNSNNHWSFRYSRKGFQNMD